MRPLAITCALLIGCSNDPLTRQSTDTGVPNSTPPDTGVVAASDSGVATDMGVVIADTGVAPPDAGEEPQVDCTEVPSLPAAFTTLTGPIHAEDFAFDDQGNMVSADEEGNLVRSNRGGQVRVWVPNATNGELAGMRFLPDGDLVFAGVDTGTLYRVAPNGATTPVVSGLEYPNGIEIDLDGMVFIAEQAAGRVRRVDPSTGMFDFVAEDMSNPNGVSFSPDYKILYVGSFGDGTVHAIDFDEQRNPSAPRLFAMTPNAPGPGGGFPNYDDLVAACAGLQTDAPCSHPYYTMKNLSPTCVDDGTGALVCYADENWPDVETPCDGLTAGTACSVAYEGTDYPGTCEDDGFGFVYCLTDELIGPEAVSGGLDGMAVDACGYVYVCEFVVGIVWRISPDGSRVEEVFHPPTQWIPNMQWGSGFGDWDAMTLYVIDRAPDITYEVQLGVPGKRKPFPR